MPKVADPLKAFRLPNRKMPMKTGQGAMRVSETPEQFGKRLMKQGKRCPPPFPVVIYAVEGNLELAALYYGVDEKTLRGLCTYDKACGEAWQKARAAKIVAEKQGKDASRALLQAASEAQELPKLPERKNWPSDPDLRVEAYRAWLIDEKALRLYEGDLVRVSEGGTIPLDVLVEMVDGDEELTDEMELGLRMAAVRAQSRLGHLSRTSNQPTAALKYIQAFGDPRFQDKSQVDVRRIGFEPPPKSADGDDDLVSVLRIVKDAQ